MIVLGFTGTQKGMTKEQHDMLQEQMISASRVGAGETEFHHGDCIGADLQAHALAFHFGYRIVIHPGDNPEKRAYANNGIYRSESAIVMEEKAMMERNQDIVDAADVLLATPRDMTHRPSTAVRGSGTWATIWRAYKSNKPVVLIYPNGFVERST